jgi:hypothetical protein
MRLRALAVAALAVATGVTSACTMGERGSRRPRMIDTPIPPAACLPPAPPPEMPGRIEGTPSIRVVWEALAIEQDQVRNSRNRQTSLTAFGEPDLEVDLLNASFVASSAQAREMRAQKAAGRTARVGDREMLDLLRELEKLGFYDYARPTDAVRPFFASDRARGRITVERDGESLTLVSQRGLGLNDATQAVPGIYAQAKYAIQLLKNRNPAMAVKDASVSPADLDAMKRSGARSTPAPSK